MNETPKGTNTHRTSLTDLVRDFGAIVALVAVVVPAIIFFVRLDERVNTIENDLQEAGTTTTDATAINALRERVDWIEDWRRNELDDQITGLAVEEFLYLTSRAREPGDLVTFRNSGPWGDWSQPRYCPRGEYVCGLQQRVEDRQGSGDDTAMNAVGFICCPFSPDR
ncbi:hypothetical protein [Candidatus Palauibacter sp.]|uniref:hypothetical protein n=1 Tax=Candidatus Palauibacter sp. TaxID=3101350 RepID=UPI003AF30E91